jgi:hypothetical protein
VKLTSLPAFRIAARKEVLDQGEDGVEGPLVVVVDQPDRGRSLFAGIPACVTSV